MFHEIELPATKSSKRNSMTWYPSDTERGGLLVLHTGKERCEYLVVEVEAAGGRAVRMLKRDDGSDPETASHDVFVPVASRYHPHCTCKGFSRHSGCKHVAALQVLVAQALIPGETEIAPAVPACVAVSERESMCPECGGECRYYCENAEPAVRYERPHNNGIAPWM